MSVLAPAREYGVEAAAPAAPARVAAVLAMVVAVVGALLGPVGQLGGALGPGIVVVAAGHVEVLTGGQWHAVAVGGRVDDGSTLRTPDGDATLTVPGGSVDLAEGSRVTTGSPLVVEVGTAVVRTAQLPVGDGAVVAQGPGAWRLDALGRVGVYAGSSVLRDVAGHETLIRAFEEVRLSGGLTDTAPRPYVYVGSDRFDRAHLAAAFGVDDFVAALGRGLAADYGVHPQPVAFYTDFDGLDGVLVAELGDLGFDRDGDRIGPPADVLVAAVVTEALVVDAGLTPAVAAAEVRGGRVAGAAWGLIVQARELDASHVRAAADRALLRRQLEVRQGTATPLVEPPTSAPGDVGSPTSPPDAGPEDPDPNTPPRPSPRDPPRTPPPGGDPEAPGVVGGLVEDLGVGDALPDEVGDPVDELVGVVDDLLGDVLGASGDADGDGGADGWLLDTVGDVLEGTVDAVTGAVGGLVGR